jgi:hypothetical protein
MSLLTIHQINIFNFDLKILNFLANLDYKEQEKAVEIIEMINKTCSYTHKNLDISSFLEDYSSFEKNDFIYNNNKIN